MSDHDELKSAIDRLRRIYAGESLTDAYCFDGVKLSGVAAEGLAEVWLQSDYKLVAEAYLARLAADEAGDEPVTEEWLKANGFHRPHKDCPYYFRLLSLNPNMEIDVCVNEDGLRDTVYGEVSIALDDEELITWEGKRATVRQLRRLIEALEGEG